MGSAFNPTGADLCTAASKNHVRIKCTLVLTFWEFRIQENEVSKDQLTETLNNETLHISFIIQTQTLDYYRSMFRFLFETVKHRTTEPEILAAGILLGTRLPKTTNNFIKNHCCCPTFHFELKLIRNFTFNAHYNTITHSFANH